MTTMATALSTLRDDYTLAEYEHVAHLLTDAELQAEAERTVRDKTEAVRLATAPRGQSEAYWTRARELEAELAVLHKVQRNRPTG